MTLSRHIQAIIDAAREATCDTHHIPACVDLGKALYAYDLARGAICKTCDGAGSIDGPEDDRGDGPPCTTCDGTGLLEALEDKPSLPDRPARDFTVTPEYSAVLKSVEDAIHATRDEGVKKRLQGTWLAIWHFDRRKLTPEEEQLVRQEIAKSKPV